MKEINNSDLGKIQTQDLRQNGKKNFASSEAEVKEGYKKTRLGWIPEEWNIAVINDTFSFLNTNSLSRNQLNYDSKDGVYNIHYGDLHATYKQPILDFEKNERIPKINNDVVLSQQINFLEDGDLIIADVSEDYEGVGEAIEIKNLNGRKAVSGLHTFAFRDKKGKTSIGFRVYIFRNELVKKALKTIATGSKVYGISKRNIQKFEIVLPTLFEQKAIATCLSTWDSAITTLIQLIEKKQETKKGLMQQLLSGKKRLPGFVGEWEEKHFSDIAKRVSRKNIEGDDTVVTISAQRGFVLQEDFFNKRVASATLYNYTLVYKGEYCYNKSYSKGYPMGAFKRLEDFEKAVVTTLYICFSLKKNVDSDFINQYFEAGRMIPGLMRIAQEGGRAHGLLNIGLPDFFNLSLKIPQLKEQTAIAQVLQTADDEINLLAQKLDKMKEQKKGLMQVLLTGEKRLRV